MTTIKIFISWSGQHSHGVAIALKQWLPYCFQGVQVFVSSEDIRKGRRWLSEITRELANTNFGIICLTPDNLQSPWVLFEAGALSKLESAQVCTLLLGNLRAGDIEGPLSNFQNTQFNNSDFFKLIQTINLKFGKSAQEEGRLKHIFEKFWGDLEISVEAALTKSGMEAKSDRTEKDLLYEILEVSRFIAENTGAGNSELIKLRRLLGLSVYDIDLSDKTAKLLMEAGISDVGRLSEAAESEVSSILGSRTLLNEVKDKMKSLNLNLGMTFQYGILPPPRRGNEQPR